MVVASDLLTNFQHLALVVSKHCLEEGERFLQHIGGGLRKHKVVLLQATLPVDEAHSVEVFARLLTVVGRRLEESLTSGDV